MQYRLRAGTPMPTQERSEFKLHSFMAAKAVDVSELCVEDLPNSSSFTGQGADFTSANYSQLPLKGGLKFRGSITNEEVYIDEDELPATSSEVEFIEAGSVNVAYSVSGIAQISYTIITNSANFNLKRTLMLGKNEFNGYAMTASSHIIPGSEQSDSGGWYITNVSMLATKG